LNRLAIALLADLPRILFPPLIFIRLPNGRGWVFWVLCVVMLVTLWRICRQAFRRAELAAVLSPGRLSPEHAVTCRAVVAGIAGASFLSDALNWTEILALSLTLSLLAQIGDLFESWIS